MVIIAAIVAVVSAYAMMEYYEASNITALVSPKLTPTPNQDETADWKTYNSGEYGFEIKYPKSYSVLEKDDMPASYAMVFNMGASEFKDAKTEELNEVTFVDSEDADAYRNDETHNGDGHFKTIDVAIYNNGNNYTLEQWFKKNTEVTSFEASFTSQEEITIDGSKGTKGIYGCCLAYKKTIFLGKNGKFYKISGNYLDGDPSVVPISNEDMFDQMLATFKFTILPTPSSAIKPSIFPSPKPQTKPIPTPKISEEYLAPLSQAEPERFVISLDITKDEIIDKLFTEGFIRSKEAFSAALAATAKGDNPIEPGGYKIAKNMNAWEIAKVLAAKPYMKWVVIPEGLRKEEIADLLANSLGWSDAKKNKWITAYTALKYDYIEGVYFPDTYLIPADETPQAVANRLTAKFEEKFAPYSKEFAAQGIQWTTAIRMASVVQREAANDVDMPLIAGIIWNRLLSDMKLEIDATVQYARGKTLSGWWAPIKVEDLKIDSRYNTYLYKGLPPHPISNPGLPAIEATLSPAKTDCLFYIHDKDKQTHCAETYEEHQQNIVKYLQ